MARSFLFGGRFVLKRRLFIVKIGSCVSGYTPTLMVSHVCSVIEAALKLEAGAVYAGSVALVSWASDLRGGFG